MLGTIIFCFALVCYYCVLVWLIGTPKDADSWQYCRDKIRQDRIDRYPYLGGMR